MEFEEVVHSRRAVNYFDTQKAVPDNLIREIIEKAAKSPSSYNLQPWSLIILSDPEEKALLRRHALNQAKITEAPYVFIVLADRDGWKEGHTVVTKNFRKLVASGRKKEEDRAIYINSLTKLYGENPEKQQAFAVKNSAFFAMSLMLAAKDVGLDTHPMDGFDHEGVRGAFNIPENYWIPLLLAVGYFDETKKLYDPNWRKTYDEIVVKF